jgi:ATP-dependent 26S proteasome regulatory subunit
VQVGEGEKMVRALFAVAAVHQPSVVRDPLSRAPEDAG